MRLRLANLGIPSMPGRSRPIRELLRQASAAIVVGMLRYSASKTGASQPDTGRPGNTTCPVTTSAPDAEQVIQVRARGH